MSYKIASVIERAHGILHTPIMSRKCLNLMTETILLIISSILLLVDSFIKSTSIMTRAEALDMMGISNHESPRDPLASHYKNNSNKIKVWEI